MSNFFSIKLSSCFILSLILSFAFANVCLAHYSWIQVDNFNFSTVDNIDIFIANGHKFPVMANFMEASRLDDIYIVNNNNNKISIDPTSKFKLKSNNKLKKGSYILAAYSKYFSSDTPSGYYKFKTKEDLDNVTKCELNHKCMKSIINSKNAHDKVDFKVGHSIEIIPLKNPLNMDKGEFLPIQVLLNGDPLQDSQIHATYMGYYTKKQKYKGFGQTVRTNQKGKAKIKLDHRGIWLIKAYSKSPYPNKEVCDIKEFIASLTFRME